MNGVGAVGCLLSSPPRLFGKMWFPAGETACDLPGDRHATEFPANGRYMGFHMLDTLSGHPARALFSRSWIGSLNSGWHTAYSLWHLKTRTSTRPRADTLQASCESVADSSGILARSCMAAYYSPRGPNKSQFWDFVWQGLAMLMREWEGAKMKRREIGDGTSRRGMG